MSHFSFTRNSSDKCAIEQKDKESMSPFRWATDLQVKESKDSCFLGVSPFMHSPFFSVPEKVVDIESDLKGQTRNLSKCNNHKFIPGQTPPIKSNFIECKDTQLIPEHTRVKRACNVLSGITINRFNPLCDDLQDTNKIHLNTYIGKNTRLQVKDAFKNGRVKKQ
jgi:hypothetical protein